jgi:hypothetical protein
LVVAEFGAEHQVHRALAYEFVIYLDEAGDAGFGKLRNAAAPSGQTRWFAVGCCIVSRTNDALLPKWRDTIVGAIPRNQRRDIHFRDLRSHDAKVFVCSELAKLPVGICVALSNKVTLLDLRKPLQDKFKQPDHLQNYLTRFVLERVSHAIKRRQVRLNAPSAKAKVVFSQRGRMNYDGVKDYLRLIKEGREKRYSPGRIDWDVIDPDMIDVQPHAKLAGLQFADVATSAFWRALEPTEFGHCEPRYANELRKRVIADGRGDQLGVGIIPIPKQHSEASLTDEQLAFLQSWKKRQAPGP